MSAMFGLGVPEMLFILLLALLIFGPKRLPDIGRTLGKGLAEFRRASTELQRSINTELSEPEPPPPAERSRQASFPEKPSNAAPPAGALARGEAAEEKKGEEEPSQESVATGASGDEGSEHRA